MLRSVQSVLLFGIIASVSIDAAIAQRIEHSESRPLQDPVDRLLQTIPSVEELKANTSHHEWTISRPYNRIRDYADRPDDQTLKSLTIEWQKPELDALGNFCTIRGQLKTPDNGQHGTKPITWFQGVTVYMAMTFDAKPDWSKEVNQVDAMYEIAATSPSGKFRVYFDLRESSYERTRAQYFQFGVALAKHVTSNKTSQNVVWNSRTPVQAGAGFKLLLSRTEDCLLDHPPPLRADVEATRGIRLQALAMVKGLLQPLSAREAARDDRWRALLKAATERGIDWDAKREQFVARECTSKNASYFGE
jgi:hypothetical protein